MSAKNSPQIKICGITNYPDAVIAIDSGADLIGFNFFPQSKRYITPVDAQVIVRRLPPVVEVAGIFVNADISEVKRIAQLVPLDILQFHGDEDESYLKEFQSWKTIKVFRLQSINDLELVPAFTDCVDFFLFDTFIEGEFGGTGSSIHSELLTSISNRGFLTRGFISGGLTSENVAQIIAEHRPYGVDVASGVERSPGQKDTAKIRDFVKNSRSV